MTQNKRKKHVAKPSPDPTRSRAEVNQVNASEGKEARENAENYGNPGQGGKRLWTSYERGTTLIQGATLLVLVFYTFYTYSMWREMGTSAEREERFFRLSHRARLSTVVADNFELRPDNIYEVKATYRNDPASLPAENVVARAQIVVIDPSAKLAEPLAFVPPLLKETPVTIVGPGAGAFVPAIWGTDVNGAADIKEGRKKLYFYGIITYSDAFKTDGLLEFCFFYWPPVKGWRYCENHNTAH